MIYGHKPILDIPTERELGGSSLEELIRRDFGEAGLVKFKEYGLTLSVPWYDEFKLRVGTHGSYTSLVGGIGPTQTGWVYDVHMDKVQGIATELPVVVNYDRSTISSNLVLTFDLKPEVVNPRYLHLVFDNLERVSRDE